MYFTTHSQIKDSILTHGPPGTTLTTMADGERRKWQRLEHGLRVELTILGSASGSVSALGTYLSPDGIFVQLADPPRQGSRLRISLAAGDTVSLSAEGVVTNQFKPSDEHDISGIGIAFDEAGASWRKLYDWLSTGAS